MTNETSLKRSFGALRDFAVYSAIKASLYLTLYKWISYFGI